MSRCEDCGTHYERNSPRQDRCPDCQALRSRMRKFEATERTRRIERVCPGCNVMHLEKNAPLCDQCAIAKNPNFLSQHEDRRKHLRKVKPRGVWRVGPVIFDWSGESGAWRCSEHPSEVGLSFDLATDRALIRHARVWHQLGLSDAIELPEPSFGGACASCAFRPMRPQRVQRDRLCSMCRLRQVRERTARLRAERCAA